MLSPKQIKEGSVKFGKFNEPLFYRPGLFWMILINMLPIIMVVVGVVNAHYSFAIWPFLFILGISTLIYQSSPYVGVWQNEFVVHRICKVIQVPIDSIVKARFLRGNKTNTVILYSKDNKNGKLKEVLALNRGYNYDRDDALKELLQKKGIEVTTKFKWQEEERRV